MRQIDGHRLSGSGTGLLPEFVAELLALGYLRYVRGPACQAAEKGSTRARKGLDDVAPRGKVSPGPASPSDGGSSDGS